MTKWSLLKTAASARIQLVLVVLCLASTAAFSAPPNDLFYNSKGTWDNNYDDQWGLKAVGFTDPANPGSAWAIETGESNPIIVAVIDTGLDYFHPDLSPDTLWRNPHEQANGIDDDGNGYVDDLIGWNFLYGDNNPWDYSGHGTHVSGIIGAASNNGEGIAGVNWGVKIMPLKIMNFVGRGRTVRMAEAIYYAVKHGARVINLSLGAEHVSQIQRDAISYAAENNVVVVVAAGNTGEDSAGFSPAGLDNVITVAATNHDGRRADFSNWGDSIDLAAPGVDILSLRARRTDLSLLAGVEDYSAAEGFVGPANQLYRVDGTSFSAPFVTGVASLILARNPHYTAEQVRRIILNSARDVAPSGIDRNTGYGLLDAYAALTADPDFFLTAKITGVGVTQVDGKPSLSVLGSFDSDDLDEAWIELGEGDTPGDWKKVSKTLKKAVANDVLDNLDINLFRGAKVWTLKLVVRHKLSKSREYHYLLTLG